MAPRCFYTRRRARYQKRGHAMRRAFDVLIFMPPDIVYAMHMPYDAYAAYTLARCRAMRACRCLSDAAFHMPIFLMRYAAPRRFECADAHAYALCLCAAR